jgi:hypothetical protein
MTQVGYNFMLAMYTKSECCQSINMCVNMMQEKLIPFFPWQVKKKPHDKMQIVCLVLNWAQSQTVITNFIT